MTFLSGVGMLTVIFGVIVYNEGKNGEKKAGILNAEHNTMITWRDV